MPATDIAVLVVQRDRPTGRVRSLADWGGAPLLQRVVEAAAGWGLGDTFVVLGRDADLALRACDFGDAGVVEDPEWEEGSASPLRVGLDTIARSGRHEAALVVWSDEPGIPDRVVKAVVDAYRARGASAVVPKYRYARAFPVLIDQVLWDRLMGAEGDSRILGLLQTHPEWVEEVWVDAVPPRRVASDFDEAELRPRR